MNVAWRELIVFKLFHDYDSLCNVCLCLCMHNYIENAYKLIICNECIAMCRAFLFCVFPFSQWLPAICSSRSVLGFQSPFQITDTQVWVPSKNRLGEKQQAALLTFTAASQVASRCCFASSWYRGRDAGGAWPSMGRGKRGDCLTGALRRLRGAESSSASLKKEKIWGLQL